MGIFGTSEQKKKIKELRENLKQLKKTLLAAGNEKGKVTVQLKELEETLVLADTLQKDYAAAKECMGKCLQRIEQLLNCLGQSSPEEEKKSLKQLTEDLDHIYHDCSIRVDDQDFQSTSDSLKKLVAQYGGAAENNTAARSGISGVTKSAGDAANQETAGNTVSKDVLANIMLRSELENIKAVLDDAYGWSAPDFMALAYFVRHEDKTVLADMENEQRNTHMTDYLETQFLKEFRTELAECGQEEAVKQMIESYVHTDENSSGTGVL
jgi:small-conductance mechanosensitive channel